MWVLVPQCTLKPGDNFVKFSPLLTWVLGIKLRLQAARQVSAFYPLSHPTGPKGMIYLFAFVGLKLPSFGLHLVNCKVRIIYCTVCTSEVSLTMSSGHPFLPRSDFSSHPMSLMSLKKQRILFRD